MIGRGKSAALATELDFQYRTLQSSFSVRFNADYETLVVPNGNGGEAVHRWFRLKEAFSRRLLTRVVKDLGLDRANELSVLDPYVGSGTSAASLADMVRDGMFRRARVYGYECNPFLELVASSKLAAMQKPSSTFLSLAKKVAATAARDRVEAPPIPTLAAFHNPAFFAARDLKRLLQLRAAISSEAEAGAHPLDVHLARVCLGASVEPSSALRRDGRALRYQPSKERAAPIAEFLRRAEAMQEDMPRRGISIAGRIMRGDGRLLRPYPPRSASIDLVIFSPPYPNNIDYTEVYKLEAWLLGFVGNAAEFAAQRLRTVYSHPSLLRSDVHEDADVLLSPAYSALCDAIPDDRYQRARAQMIRGYFTDMAQTLRSAMRVLHPGGHLVYVVGNSLHGEGESSFVIAADILMAELARRIGFTVDRIDVARHLRRRQRSSPYLRESVVFLRRPAA